MNCQASNKSMLWLHLSRMCNHFFVFHAMHKSFTLLLGFPLLLLLLELSLLCHALFEYICDEKQLYKPYIHVYKQRKGPRLLDLGPGFHELSEYQNVYICVNGLAYLYFAKTTTVSEVYEAPRLKKYAHICEMYNVQPREGSATVTEVTLHLKAILLLGDPTDYRLPSIQKFTAPYFFRKDQLNTRLENEAEYEPQPPLYINASSVLIIGQSECTLSKGNKNSVIKVRPHVFPPEPPSFEKKAEVGYFCKLGFLPLLEKASTPPKGPVPADDIRAPVLALINDEAIRVEKCDAFPTFSESDLSGFFGMITKEIDDIDAEYVQKKQDFSDKYNSEVDPVIQKLTDEKAKLEDKKKDPKIKPKDLKKVDKQLEKVQSKLEQETEKKGAFQKAVDDIGTQVSALSSLKSEADPSGGKGNTAKTDKDSAEAARTEWEQLKAQTPAAPQTDIEAKEVAYETAKRKARDSARDYLNALSDLEVAVQRLKKAVEKVKHMSIFIPSPARPEKGATKTKGPTAIKLNPEGSSSVVITAQETDCEKLPVLEGEEGECQKGKPNKTYVCKLFSTTLGVRDPWTEVPPAQPPAAGSTPPPAPQTSDPATRGDIWKREVLELIGDIFSTACDKIRDVEKFVKMNNRVMGFYLTNDEVFNMEPNPLTDTCINYRFTSAMEPSSSTNLNFKEEKQFWSTLKFVLKECKMEGRRLAFKENATVAGLFKFVKNYGTDQAEEYEVLHHEEQADVEYSYNWPIDMNWKMFVTVMGICLTGYEKKIPLIASRFFSLYTEDFLIPLRETWVNPKDNTIFQFILSEFYNSHTEFWMDMCMESSFIYAGQRDYRPPRSLMVNCHSEHNYFVNGIFSKSTNPQ